MRLGDKTNFLELSFLAKARPKKNPLSAQGKGGVKNRQGKSGLAVQMVLHCKDSRLYSAVEIKLAQNALHVDLDR